MRKTFTSDLISDTHLGRQDEPNQGIAELLYHLTDAAGLTLGFQHTQRTSTNALRRFNDTIVSLGGRCGMNRSPKPCGLIVEKVGAPCVHPRLASMERTGKMHPADSLSITVCFVDPDSTGLKSLPL